MAKEGSTISGFADAFAQAVSYALQYGVPLQVLVDKFSHVRFEPSGLTKNPDVRMAKSIVDYIFRWMATKFLSAKAQYQAGVNLRENAENNADGEQLTLAEAGWPDDVQSGMGPQQQWHTIRDSERPGRPAMLNLWCHHDSQWCLLQMCELWHYERLRLVSTAPKDLNTRARR